MGNKAIKYRIYPNEEQRVLFAKTFGCCRFIWNHTLADCEEFYSATMKHFVPTPATYKAKNPFLCEVDSLALANVQLDLKGAYRAFFKKEKGFPTYKSKKNPRLSYTTNNQKNTVALVNKGIKLPKVGIVKAKLHRLPKTGWILKSATISCTSTKKYYCSVLFEFTDNVVKEVLPTAETTLGLDYSSPHFYIDSNGEKANHGRYYRRAEKKLAKAQRKLSRKQFGSNNYQKQKAKVALIEEKAANQRKDFCHKLSRKIANSYDAVCVEDLNLQNIARSLRLGKSTNDNGFGMFRVMLDYKLAEQGKHLIKIPKFYPSSKRCHNCKTINTELTLKDRVWICSCCGKTIQRDYNAALNIRDAGILQFYSESELVS